jgi:REP element-mobilizing transposase RayT
LEIADGVYHVTNRGLERREIVRTDRDRNTWLRLLHRVATRCDWRVFAFVLLDNHFHLFLRTPKPNLSAGMHDLESGYASLFNRNYERAGPLFQGRFHSVIVETESHSAELSRYVHLNTVRAGLEDQPLFYRWSSYRFYLDPRGAPDWLDWRTTLAQFGARESAARMAYKRFVEAGLTNPPPNPLKSASDGWILGSARFVVECRRAAEANGWSPRDLTPERILERVAEFHNTTTTELTARGRHKNVAREAAIFLCRELLDEPLGVIADRFHVSRSAIVEAANRAQKRAESDAQFREALKSLRTQLRDSVGWGGGGVVFFFVWGGRRRAHIPAATII